MAGGFTAIDLSRLPPPNVVEPLDFEAIYAAFRADVVARDPSLGPALQLESEPLAKLCESFAYRELVLRSDANLKSLANTLAYATGSMLDHLGANRGVARLAGEDDERFRQRIALAPEGWSTAGPEGAYVFHALSADVRVADVAVDSPSPGVVRVTVLSAEGDGSADVGLVATVQAALSARDVRPLTDLVQVGSATAVPYAVQAELTPLPGPDPDVVLEAARAKLSAYAAERRRLGRDVTRAGITAALFVAGVQNVSLIAPVADVAVGPREAAALSADDVELAIGGADV